MNFLIKKLTIVKIILLTLSITISSPSYSEMDPKITALGTMAVYGTVGGLLLGVASLAFGTSGRAVAQGASIGLYTGLIFGGYVVGSHAMKKRQGEQEEESEDYYPDTQESPYESYFFREKDLKEKIAKEHFNLKNQKILKSLLNKKTSYLNKRSHKLYYVNLVSYQF